MSQSCYVLGYRRDSFYRFKVSMRELALQDISRKTAGFAAGLLKIWDSGIAVSFELVIKFGPNRGCISASFIEFITTEATAGDGTPSLHPLHQRGNRVEMSHALQNVVRLSARMVSAIATDPADL